MNERERIEAQAVRAGVTLMGGRAEHVGGALCCALREIPILEFNRALPLGEVIDLDAIESWFETPYAVCVTPDRNELATELAARGYEPGEAWMKFARDAAPAPPVQTELRVEPTLDVEAFVAGCGSEFPEVAARFADALIGSPGWSCFIAWAEDEPAAVAALHVDGRSAWFGVAMTRPEHRGRGGQSALLAARIERARELGATLLVSETGERAPARPGTSYRNLLKAGFREAYLRANWRQASRTMLAPED